MASFQGYQSHGRPYFRIVESFRKDGKPHIRVLHHLGGVEDLLRLIEQERATVQVASVSAGAVTALHRLAEEFDISGKINAALLHPRHAVQTRHGLRVGETLLAGIIRRICAPRSKRAFAAWAQETCLADLMDFTASDLTSQYLSSKLSCAQVIATEGLQPRALGYDTTNFYTHIASTNTRPELPQRGHNKQGRHDLRQLGLALVVDQQAQLPLTHCLSAGARSDMRTFAELIKPIGQRLRALSIPAEQLTLVFDTGASSRDNLQRLEDGRNHYVTALRPSQHQALLAEAATHLEEVTLSTQVMARAWRARRVIAGQTREIAVVFSPQLWRPLNRRGVHRVTCEQLLYRTDEHLGQERLSKQCVSGPSPFRRIEQVESPA